MVYDLCIYMYVLHDLNMVCVCVWERESRRELASLKHYCVVHNFPAHIVIVCIEYMCMYVSVSVLSYLSYRPSPQEEDGEGEKEEPGITRKGSGIVKEFIRTPQHTCQSPDSVPELPPSPAHSTGTAPEEEKPRNGTERRHSQVELTRSTGSTHTQKNLHGKITVLDKVDPDNRLLERVASELYHCQDNLLPFDLSRNLSPVSTEIEEEGEGGNGVTGRGGETVHPATSAPTPSSPLHSQDSYRDLLTILENPSKQEDPLSPAMPQFRPKLGTVAVHSSSEGTLSKPKSQGYRTLQRGTVSPLLSRDAIFNDFSRGRESYGYEGPPSPLSKERFSRLGEGEGGRGRRGTRVDVKKLTRKTAIRRQRRKVAGSLSELPPETSYSYQVRVTTNTHTYIQNYTSYTVYRDV